MFGVRADVSSGAGGFEIDLQGLPGDRPGEAGFP